MKCKRWGRFTKLNNEDGPITTHLTVRLIMTNHWTFSYNTVPTPTVMVIEGNNTATAYIIVL
jgi:hypothetical protein